MSSPIDPSSQEDPSHPEHIDKKVPPKIMRLTQHLHNLIYIRYFYENIGQQPPKWTTEEMGRAEEVLKQEIDKEKNQGGLLHERRQDETRTSRQERRREP